MESKEIFKRIRGNGSGSRFRSVQIQGINYELENIGVLRWRLSSIDRPIVQIEGSLRLVIDHLSEQTEKFPPYSEMSSEWLVEHHEALREEEEIANLMDGSGDCGGMIHDSFAPLYREIENILNERFDIGLLYGDPSPDFSNEYDDEDDILPY